MKKIILFFALFCAIFANEAAAQATKYPFVVVPKNAKVACQKGCTDLLQGTLVLEKLNIKIQWNLIYDKKAGKIGTMSFAYPDGVDKEKFETTIQAMTAGEYWTGTILCQGAETPTLAISCINNLMVTALGDCCSLGGVHCWMNN